MVQATYNGGELGVAGSAEVGVFAAVLISLGDFALVHGLFHLQVVAGQLGHRLLEAVLDKASLQRCPAQRVLHTKLPPQPYNYASTFINAPLSAKVWQQVNFALTRIIRVTVDNYDMPQFVLGPPMVQVKIMLFDVR